MIDTLPLWASIPASVLLVLGGLLALTGSAGLLRFRTFYARIHAPTLGNTMGCGCVLAASILVFSALSSRPVFHEVDVYTRQQLYGTGQSVFPLHPVWVFLPRKKRARRATMREKNVC